MKRQVTNNFLNTHPVFSLDEATEVFAPSGGKAGTVERLSYHLQAGRLKRVAREIYAVVPIGVAVDSFQPDPFLVAAAIKPGGVFSHHSALELLGAAHVLWNQHTLYVNAPRRPLQMNGIRVLFRGYPQSLRRANAHHLGTRSVEHRGRILSCTGPERTLVEGFRRPDLAGGLEELVLSASGFPVLDLGLLEEVLRVYDICNLWAGVGWFLEKFQSTFHVPDDFLRTLERNRPKSPQYLPRDHRGGTLIPGWNLILPSEVISMGETDAS